MSDTRCQVTELLVSACGCRAHRGRPAPPDPFESAEDKSPWIRASFDGECSECDGAIWVGELIRADGFGGWKGKDCCG